MVKWAKKNIALLIISMFFVLGTSCREPTVDERWDASFEQLLQESSMLAPLEQLYLARKILSERPDDFRAFCGYQHSSEVEFECSNILKRPHLLNKKKKLRYRSALWKIPAVGSDVDLKSATPRIQKAALDSAEAVAAICNGFSVDYLRYECYFIAADVLHQHHTRKQFDRMLALCEASGFYLSFCLSHIQHRTVLPMLGAPAEQWKKIDEKLVWISQSAHGFSAEFREELAVYLSMNIMLKTADLCLPEYLPELELGPFLRDAFVIVWLSDWRGNKPFAEVLPILQKEIQEPCKGEASMRAQRGIEFHSSWRFEDARTISGDTRRFLDRQRRMISEDSQEDLAIALVEAAGVLQRRFLIHEALSYPSEKVVQTAKRIQKYPAE